MTRRARFNKELAKHIRERADELGLSQGAIAVQMGVSRPMISMMMNNKRFVYPQDLHRLCRILKWKMDELLPPHLGSIMEM